MKNLHQVISAEIERIKGWFPIISIETVMAGAVREATEALPREGEGPLEWAERNAGWFQCPIAGVYSEGFFEAVEAAGEKDYNESLRADRGNRQ